MSDQPNMFDNLRDDETRSEEGSTMGSDTADFFVDDDAPVRVLGSDGVADILDKDDSDVPKKGHSRPVFGSSLTYGVRIGFYLGLNGPRA